MLGADPAPYTIAGAFILGATLATFAVIRVMRAVLGEAARARRRPLESDRDE